MKYARCRYCDSSFNIKHLFHEDIEKEEGIEHDRIRWVCLVCAQSNKSFIFIEDDIKEE